MPGHVQVYAPIGGDSDFNAEFSVADASWVDGRVEIHLRHKGPGTATMDELRLRLDATAVTEIVGAVMRFAKDAELGVIE